MDQELQKPRFSRTSGIGRRDVNVLLRTQFLAFFSLVHSCLLFPLLRIHSPCRMTTTGNSWIHILMSSSLEIKWPISLTYFKLLGRSLIGTIPIRCSLLGTVYYNLQPLLNGKFKSQKRKMLGKPSKQISTTID